MKLPRLWRPLQPTSPQLLHRVMFWVCRAQFDPFLQFIGSLQPMPTDVSKKDFFTLAKDDPFHQILMR